MNSKVDMTLSLLLFFFAFCTFCFILMAEIIIKLSNADTSMHYGVFE